MSDENCPGCADCGQPLANSVYLIRGSIYKSCALCSRVEGQHVYHRIIEFGMWHANTDDKRPYPQSECVRAYRARVAATEPVAGKYGEALALILPTLPAQGRRCVNRKGEVPMTASNPLVVEALEPLREEAEAELAGSHPIGRALAGKERKRVVRPGEVATSRFQGDKMDQEPLAMSNTDRKSPTRPTVLRRRKTGETVAAEAV